MQKILTGASSPHITSKDTTRTIMRDVLIALAPVCLAGVWFYGLRVAIIIALSVASAVLSEYIYCQINKKANTTSDLSAAVTGVILACNLPPAIPWWIPVIGSAIAILLVKMIFGGIGQNFMNPAMAARAILLASWATAMTTWSIPQPGHFLQGLASPDAISGATPMVILNSGVNDYHIKEFFLGGLPGCIGETSALAILLGLAYMFYRNIISWRIPVCFIATVAILSLLPFSRSDETVMGHVLSMTMSGGLLFGAVFMAPDYTTSPITPVGQIIYAIGCGVVTYIIRTFGAFPEGVTYGILFMNVATPLIEKYTKITPFGVVKKARRKEAA